MEIKIRKQVKVRGKGVEEEGMLCRVQGGVETGSG